MARDGPVNLLDLFDGRRQLVVYRFFYEPGVADWPEGACRGCSVVPAIRSVTSPI